MLPSCVTDPLTAWGLSHGLSSRVYTSPARCDDSLRGEFYLGAVADTDTDEQDVRLWDVYMCKVFVWFCVALSATHATSTGRRGDVAASARGRYLNNRGRLPLRTEQQFTASVTYPARSAAHH